MDHVPYREVYFTENPTRRTKDMRQFIISCVDCQTETFGFPEYYNIRKSTEILFLILGSVIDLAIISRATY